MKCCSEKASCSALPNSSEGDFVKVLWLTEELMEVLAHSEFFISAPDVILQPRTRNSSSKSPSSANGHFITTAAPAGR